MSGLHTQAISHQESDLNTDRISVAILEERGGRNNTLAVVSIPFLQISHAGIVTTLAQIKSCFGWNKGASC